MRTENLLAFERIWTMSMVGAFGMEGVGAPLGDEGTKGTVLNPGAGDGGDCGFVGIGGDDNAGG